MFHARFLHFILLLSNAYMAHVERFRSCTSVAILPNQGYSALGTFVQTSVRLEAGFMRAEMVDYGHTKVFSNVTVEKGTFSVIHNSRCFL